MKSGGPSMKDLLKIVGSIKLLYQLILRETEPDGIFCDHSLSHNFEMI